MGRATLLTLFFVGGLGAAILLAWGPRAFVGYAFFALLALVIGFGLRLSGGWIEDVSRDRFPRD